MVIFASFATRASYNCIKISILEPGRTLQANGALAQITKFLAADRTGVANLIHSFQVLKVHRIGAEDAENVEPNHRFSVSVLVSEVNVLCEIFEQALGLSANEAALN